MEISCRPAGAAMPGQPLPGSGRTDGSAAAAFAILLEAPPTEAAVQDEDAPVDEAAPDNIEEQDEDPDTSPASHLPPDGAPVLFGQAPPGSAEGGPFTASRITGNQPVTLAAGRSQPAEPASRAGLRDAAALAALEPSGISGEDGVRAVTDAELDPRAPASDGEDARDLGQPRPIRAALTGPSAPETADLVLGSAASRDTGQGSVKDDDSATPLAVESADQAGFAVSVRDSISPARNPHLHNESLHRPSAADPRHVLRQIGERLGDGQEGVIEIVLSPEELGRVRLVIAAGERPAVTVFADRPEICDLLRRNADSLDKELQGAGIFGADISFADGNENRNARHDAPAGGPGVAWSRDESANQTDSADPGVPKPGLDRRIDIRI